MSLNEIKYENKLSIRELAAIPSSFFVSSKYQAKLGK